MTMGRHYRNRRRFHNQQALLNPLPAAPPKRALILAMSWSRTVAIGVEHLLAGLRR